MAGESAPFGDIRISAGMAAQLEAAIRDMSKKPAEDWRKPPVCSMVEPDPTLRAKLFGALAKAQGEFKEVKRDRTVTVKMKSGGTYTYSYATLGHIRSCIQPALAANGIAWTQLIKENTLVLIVGHEAGGCMVSVMPFPIDTREPQATGSLMTYLRRYQVTGAFGVAADEDDDGQVFEQQGQPPAQSQKKARRNSNSKNRGAQKQNQGPVYVSVQKMEALAKLAAERGWQEGDVLEFCFKAWKIADVPEVKALKLTEKGYGMLTRAITACSYLEAMAKLDEPKGEKNGAGNPGGGGASDAADQPPADQSGGDPSNSGPPAGGATGQSDSGESGLGTGEAGGEFGDGPVPPITGGVEKSGMANPEGDGSSQP